MVGTIPAAAQWLDRPTPGIPRTPDGKPNLTAPAPRGPDGKPDLTGIWNGPVPVPRLDPANAQPWVNDLVRQRQQDYYRMRPSYQCLPSGPEADRFAGWKRILQTPTALAILNDDLTYRVIHMDGRELEANPAPSWMGYSVGRWDGDTLVVDSVGFNDKTWLSQLWAAAYGGAACDGAIPAPGRRPPAGRGDLHRSGRVREAVGLYGEHGAGRRYGNARVDLRTQQRALGRQPLGRRESGGDRCARRAGAVRRRLQRDLRGTKRTVEVSLSGGQLIANLRSRRRRPRVGSTRSRCGRWCRISQTLFEGLGLGYQFIVDDKGVATDVVEIHISGPYRYPRLS